MIAYHRPSQKQVEKLLHPPAFINGIEIVHNHFGKNILFGAFDDGIRLNDKEFALTEEQILDHSTRWDFYKAFNEDFAWLVKKD